MGCVAAQQTHAGSPAAPGGGGNASIVLLLSPAEELHRSDWLGAALHAGGGGDCELSIGAVADCALCHSLRELAVRGFSGMKVQVYADSSKL